MRDQPLTVDPQVRARLRRRLRDVSYQLKTHDLPGRPPDPDEVAYALREVITILLVVLGDE